ncbi:FxSxx-COOH system tetratricopeptide repeat protein [Nonomuraea rubra]|uniref:Tetratricopeptide (TPR) repeat protein n=1 Tax=Nonomuraea rubra TaxID=46180 RepID=A0A7X0U493_9ACTN|nr:FxSxx-COOH system tetratricopeptide repeat protein [Nonomuraea rubra]MBB6554747.1 tetratricopeptide (TPR) repeat protein [Nonomuraea rubra]
MEHGARQDRRLPIWGREIPYRNRYFTGRERELAELRERLALDSTALVGQPPQPIYGMGGIGKTEIAAEYAHRHSEDYDLVWWVRAEQEETIINALIGLGRKMALNGFRPDDRDYSAKLVLSALAAHDPFERWLLIYDNVESANEVQNYLPSGGGHVIITTRDRHWRRAMNLDGIEVGEFLPEDTVKFLHKRVIALSGRGSERSVDAEAEAQDLAGQLGNLPLAAEHAAAYLNETGTSITEYLALFRDNAHALLASSVDIKYPQTVATTWSVSRNKISPEADALFRLLASLSAEPVAEELLVQPTVAASLPEPLSRVLSSVTDFRRAARELGRYSMLKLDGVRNVVQLHRVVQAVTRDRMVREDPEAAARYREAAHLLLAASDPRAVDREDSEQIYQRSLQHLVPSKATESGDPNVRRLIINQVEQLFRRGGHQESLRLGLPTLESWRERFGPDDKHTLALALQVGNALRVSGRWEESQRLLADTLRRLHDGFGELDPVYLDCARVHGIGLRLLGRYAEALQNDQKLLPLFERELRPDHPDTLRIRSNVAVSLRCLGRFAEALEYDDETLAERLRIFGPVERPTLSSQFGRARCLRGLGRYEESLDLVRRISNALERGNYPWNQFRLLVAIDFGVALNRVGLYEDAFVQGRKALDLHQSILGKEHRQTLQSATNLMNDHRLTEDLAGAQRLGEETVASLEKVAGTDHPNTLMACSNLAIVLRVRNNPDAARRLSERAVEGLIADLGEDHPNTLIAMHSLASDLAALGEVRKARSLGEKVLERSQDTRGADHPNTLAAMANLALDRNADGDKDAAARLREEALDRYRNSLLPDHPHARLAAQFGRINMGIEPMND